MPWYHLKIKIYIDIHLVKALTREQQMNSTMKKLLPENFIAACEYANQPLNLRMQDG